MTFTRPWHANTKEVDVISAVNAAIHSGPYHYCSRRTCLAALIPENHTPKNQPSLPLSFHL